MKIPGLDDALSKLDKFDEMQPVLESIDNNLRVLAQVMIRESSMSEVNKAIHMDNLTKR